MSDVFPFDFEAAAELAAIPETDLHIEVTQRALKMEKPFAITGYVFDDIRLVHVTISKDSVSGKGEGAGVYYLDETADTMIEQLQAVIPDLSRTCSLNTIQEALPSGGARNAMDCAYWDYLAKREGKRVSQMLGLDVQPLTTVFTIGIDNVDTMADNAAAAKNYSRLKIKLDADQPIEKMKAIRSARPDANIIVDANQGWTIEQLKEIAPAFAELDVAMIEQPLVRGGDHSLEGFESPVPLGADESCLNFSELNNVLPYYDVINIKLDKSGGLTEALKLAEGALKQEKSLMVGNMLSSSLAMAPSFMIGQACTFVDLDGPLLLQSDIENGLVYGEGGRVEGPTPALWG